MTAKRVMRGIGRFFKVLLIILASMISAAAIGLVIYYFYADSIIFDYVEANVGVCTNDQERDEWLMENGYAGRYPFFGNSATLSGYGAVKGYPLGAGRKNEIVYTQIQNPIYDYVFKLVEEHGNEIKVDYNVENNGKELTVSFDVTVYPNGIENEGENFQKVFVYDIENAAPDHLPRLISEEYTPEQIWSAVYTRGLDAPYSNNEEYIRSVVSTINFFIDKKAIFENEYHAVYYPVFRNYTRFGPDYSAVYDAMNEPLREFAQSTADKYNNLVDLDFTGAFYDMERRRQTITFSGFGYPDGENGRAEKIEKTFEFDVTDVSNENPPVLSGTE